MSGGASWSLDPQRPGFFCRDREQLDTRPLPPPQRSPTALAHPRLPKARKGWRCRSCFWPFKAWGRGVVTVEAREVLLRLRVPVPEAHGEYSRVRLQFSSLPSPSPSSAHRFFHREPIGSSFRWVGGAFYNQSRGGSRRGVRDLKGRQPYLPHP